MHKSILFLIAALLLAPLAQAHGAPNPIEAEDFILDDEATDIGIAWDGFDIQAVHVREAYMPGMGGHGIIYRWTLWGGDSIGLAASHDLTITYASHPELALSWSTSDGGATWTGAGTVFETEFEPDEVLPLPVGQTWNVQFQAFVPHDAIGIGDTLSGMSAFAYVDGDLVDEAPGAFYIAGVPVGLVDPLDADSNRLMDDIVLDGPDRYTKSTLSLNGNTLTVNVENLISVSGQHVFVKTDRESTDVGHEHDEEGNHIGGGQEAEPGQDLNFTLDLGNFRVAKVLVETDLGGQEVFWVQSDGTVTDTEPSAAGGNPAKNTPALPVSFAIIALALLTRRK